MKELDPVMAGLDPAIHAFNHIPLFDRQRVFLRPDLLTECHRAQMESGMAEGHREAAR